MGVVNTLLYRYTGQEDIIIGTPIAGREHVDLEDQIGFYVNTLALRTQFHGTDNFRELLTNIREVTLGAYNHQSYPFDQLVDDLNLQRDLSRNPLFDVWVVVHNNDNNNETTVQQLDELAIKAYEGLENRISRFDLLFSFVETTDDLYINIQYNSDIYNKQTAGQIVDHLVQLLHRISDNPALPVNQLELLSQEEKKELLTDFNPVPDYTYPTDKTITALFQEQANSTPDHVALVFEDRSLSYEALNETANRLADYLKKHHQIERNNLVGIQLERSEWLIIAILGILKSGAAYVPLDTEYPQERIEYMVRDSNCKTVIDATILSRFIDTKEIYNAANPALVNEPDDLAYVIYTSGSTGQPKGVMITHSALTDYSFGILHKTNLRSCRTFGLVSTISADLGNTIIYTSLLTGGALYIFSAKDVMNPESMIQAQLDCLKIVPSHWKALQQKNKLFVPAKALIFGGEQLTHDVIALIKSGNASCEIYNHYGPSETTIGKLLRRIDFHVPDVQISLGTPIGDNQVYILDDRLQLLPKGVMGEICIAGKGVSKGYLGKEALTAEKFIPDPFREGGHLYKTGDLGRVLPDGSIAFIGRKDDQVKIRGFRIELGEIETVLRCYDEMDAATVISREDEAGELRIIAYIVSRENNIENIRSYLALKLPVYMMPAYFVQLPELPLTANGKIDRHKLPLPPEWNITRRTAYVAPRNEMETKVVLIWSEVLGIDKDAIGIRDSFFDLGGHSLKAIRVVLRIHEQFGLEMDLAYFFGEPTIESLVTEMENMLWLNGADEDLVVSDKRII